MIATLLSRHDLTGRYALLAVLHLHVKNADFRYTTGYRTGGLLGSIARSREQRTHIKTKTERKSRHDGPSHTRARAPEIRAKCSRGARREPRGRPRCRTELVSWPGNRISDPRGRSTDRNGARRVRRKKQKSNETRTETLDGRRRALDATAGVDGQSLALRAVAIPNRN